MHFRGEVESAFAFFRILSVRENNLLQKYRNIKPGQDVFIYQTQEKLHVMEARGQGRCFSAHVNWLHCSFPLCKLSKQRIWVN